MNLIVCVDDDYGMLFNGRRQSQDRLLRERVLRLTEGSALWMSRYTARQFAPAFAPQLRIDDAFLEKAGVGDFCFLESGDAGPYESRLETLYLYRWNRRYPADCYFRLPPEGGGRHLSRRTDFPGFSHKTITEEIYQT